jgi:hypothetical protein
MRGTYTSRRSAGGISSASHGRAHSVTTAARVRREALEAPGCTHADERPLTSPKWNPAHMDEQPRLQVDQSPRPRDRRVLRRRLPEPQPQKAAQRQRVGRAPRDAALRINPLEVADQQQPEDVPGRRLGRPSLA